MQGVFITNFTIIFIPIKPKLVKPTFNYYIILQSNHIFLPKVIFKKFTRVSVEN